MKNTMNFDVRDEFQIAKINDKYVIIMIPYGVEPELKRLKQEFESLDEAEETLNCINNRKEEEKLNKIKEQKQLEKENKEYVRKLKIDKTGSKKFKKITFKAVAGVLVVGTLAVGTIALISSKLNGNIKTTKNSNNSKTTIENANPTKEPEILDKIEVVETPMPTVEPVVETPTPTVEPIKEMTHDEKIEFIKKNAENFKNEMNAINNIKIDNNDALLELCYINGINPYELNVSTTDVVLDAVTIYGNYIDKTFTNAKNYLGYNTELRGQNNVYTDVYSKYICDESDKEIYSEIINKALKVINGCNTLTKEEVLEKSYEYNTILANDIIADEYYENCSTPVQTMILMICYNSPEMLPEKTRINIDTPIGIQQLENINKLKENENNDENYEIKFMNGEESYSNLRNEYNHLYRISTRNATMEFFLSENPDCNQQLSNKPKTYTKSI